MGPREIAALEARVKALESANATLEAALIEAHKKGAVSSSTRQNLAQSAEMQQFKAALAARDVEVGRMASEIFLLKSRLEQSRPAALQLQVSTLSNSE